MFFLRPHGRGHERVSTQEESESETADPTTTTTSPPSATNDSSSTTNQQHPPIRESDLQSALAAAGIETNHESSGLVVGGAPPSSSLTPNSDQNTNNNSGSDPSSSSNNTSSSSSSSSSSTSPTAAASGEQYYHSATSQPNNNATSSAAEHYNTHHHHPTIIRTSSPTCTLLLFFFLLRLWIEALIEQDVGLTFISLMATTWCYRWYIIRREAEREWLESATDNELSIEGSSGTTTTTSRNRSSGGPDAAVDFDPDLGLMSFQAQLAMAILESQRQMFENGGYGGNDNPSSDHGPGVTNEAKETWKKYEWGECVETTERLRKEIHKSDSRTNMIGGEGGGGGYGSVSVVNDKDEVEEQQQPMEGNEDDNASSSSLSKLEEGGGLLVKSLDDEEPSCSICLCEYENGETVTKLPCNHIYHESCLTSWTESHVRCPLCNYDLMTGFEQPEAVNRQQQQNNEAEQLAFRNMALSALGGRRIRARASRRVGRNSSRYAPALAEDSIV